MRNRTGNVGLSSPRQAADRKQPRVRPGKECDRLIEIDLRIAAQCAVFGVNAKDLDVNQCANGRAYTQKNRHGPKPCEDKARGHL